MVQLPDDFKPGFFQAAFSSAFSSVDGVDFHFIGEKFLIAPDGASPDTEILARLGVPTASFGFGHLSGRACVMKLWPPLDTLPEGLMVGDYRGLWGKWPPAKLDALLRARQLAVWFWHNRYCGRCGGAMTLSGTDTALFCPACGYRAYPRISPVVIAIIRKGDEILLGRSPHFALGMYSALAGFIEAGETVEEGLRREIREESGIEIKNIRYFGSQSWPYPHLLMLGFIADYASGELVPQEGEIEDLGWFTFNDLPVLPHPGSLAFSMIEALRQGSWPQA